MNLQKNGKNNGMRGATLSFLPQYHKIDKIKINLQTLDFCPKWDKINT